MPKVVDHRALRGQIRQAAREIFAERGLAGTGLAHVARRAGMGRASLYHYYPDKEALLADLADDLLREEMELFDAAAAVSGSGAVERIAATAAAVTCAYQRWAAEGNVLLQFWASRPQRFSDALAAIRIDVAAMIAAGQESGEIDATLDPGATAAVVVAVTDGLLLQYLLDAAAFANPEELAQNVSRAIRKVLAP